MHPWLSKMVVFCLAGTLLAGTLGGCRRSDVVAVDPENPNSPQYPYLAHEFALLQLAVDDIQELEKKKQYGKIYDDYASDEFRKNTTRRHFLVMANCTEEHLGSLTEYDDDHFGFNRNRMPAENQPALDSITRYVQREKKGQVREQMIFSGDGIHFKLNGLYWISEDKHFLQCMQEAEKIAVRTAREAQPPHQEKQAPASKAAVEIPSSKPGGAKPAPAVEVKPASTAASQPSRKPAVQGSAAPQTPETDSRATKPAQKKPEPSNTEEPAENPAD